MSEYSQSHIVWYGIVTFLTRIRQYVAILKVMNTIPYKENPFLETAMGAVEQQLLLDVAKLFDPAYYNKREENCSLNLLKQLCLTDQKRFPKGETDPLIGKIDEISGKFKSVVSKRLRDKKIAHHDLTAMFNDELGHVIFGDAVSLIEEMSDLTIEIGERLMGPTLQYPSLSALEDAYQNAFNELTKK